MKMKIFLVISLLVISAGLQIVSAAPENDVNNLTDTAQQTLNNASQNANKTSQQVNNFLNPIESILNSINSIIQQIQQIFSTFSGGQ